MTYAVAHALDPAQAVEQVEIQLGHLCNNRCVFCASGFMTNLKVVGQEDAHPALAQLEDARRRGARKVTFVGGEPTLQREFPRIVQRARELGYAEIVVFTNGVRTQQREYLEQLCAGGPLTFRVSIQGGDQATHDRVTGRAGAFQRIVDGLSLMNELGQRITVNACLNALSYQSVGGYVELARRFGVSQVHLDQINPLEIGNRPPGYLGTILARYSEQAPHLARMLGGFSRALGPEFDVNLGNIPFCVMPEWAHRIHHAGEHTMVVSANLGGLAPAGHDKYERKTEHKTKPASCRQCAFDPVCTGLFDEYAERFGTGELVPVPVERLRRQRNAAALFTLLEAPALERLSRAEPPSPFTLGSARWKPGERAARFVYERRDGGGITLAVRHPSAPGAPVAVSPTVALYVESDALDADSAALVRWAFQQLDDGDGTAPADAEMRRRLAWGVTSREHLMRLCAALSAPDGVPGHRVIVDRRAPDGESAALMLEGPEGAEVQLRLETEAPYRTPRVRARVSSSVRGGAEHAARAVMRALRVTLAGAH